MKILFFIESLHSGGKERRLVELIKGLSLDETISMEIVLTKKGIHYKDIFDVDVKIHYALRKYLKKDPVIFSKFYKIARKFKPDIIHVWGNLAAIYAIPTKVILNLPIVNNQVADAPLKVSNTILSHKLTFYFSDKIIANSYAGLKAYNAPNIKSQVIYNGFDFNRLTDLKEKADVREKFNIKTTLVVGMVASFSNKKDYLSYILAANKIIESNKDVTFLCIGAGDDLKYKQLTQDKEKILFLGKQDNVESIMNICNIGVLSTYTEGISNALLEFLALEKPVVTTFGGGNNELVANGENGYLVNQESPDELASKINLLLDSQSLRETFGRSGKKRIEEQFSIQNMVKSFKDIYTELV